MNAEHPLPGVGGLKALAPSQEILKFKKKHSFVDMMLSNILHDLPFSQTQTMKLADE